jgi:signal transduction histidine kinase
MFSSLRSRLWLTYALLVLAALSVVAVVLLFYVIRNPLAYRQTYERIQAAQKLIVARYSSTLKDADHDLFDWTAETFEVRLVIYAPDGTVLRDTLPVAGEIVPPADRLLKRRLPVLRDGKGKVWLYSKTVLPNDNILLVAAPRPRVAGLSLFADELLPLFLQGGAVALLLSLVLAFVIARWIADPLQRMLSAARAAPSAESQPVEPRGPREVQDVMRAFNSMMERVQASQLSQREFVANVSHELKTPLTAIQGFAQAILDGMAETPAARQQAAQVIHTEAARMHRMALDLLDLARLDAGTADLKMSPLDVGVLLSGIAERFAPQAQQAGVRLAVQVEELPMLVGDGDRLAQVFTNLVENALKFTPAGGEVVLAAQRDGAELVAEVRDTGMGIAPEALPRVFDRFFQADASRARQDRSGAGLGLAIAQEIIGAHGGKISVRSQVGQGTTFTVRLPLA